MGVSGGVWECGKPERFSIISMPQSEGKKGEVAFSLRRQRRRSFAPPFSPSFPSVLTVIKIVCPSPADFIFSFIACIFVIYVI